jgi:hypothetical protein
MLDISSLISGLTLAVVIARLAVSTMTRPLESRANPAAHGPINLCVPGSGDHSTVLFKFPDLVVDAA